MLGAAEGQRGHGAGQLLDRSFLQVLHASFFDVGLGAGQRGHAVPPDQSAGTSLNLLQGGGGMELKQKHHIKEGHVLTACVL